MRTSQVDKKERFIQMHEVWRKMEQQKLLGMVRGNIHEKVEDWNAIPAYQRISITRCVMAFAEEYADKLKEEWHNDEEESEEHEEQEEPDEEGADYPSSSDGVHQSDK